MTAGCLAVQQESVRVFNVCRNPAEFYAISLTWRHGHVGSGGFIKTGVWLDICSLFESQFFKQCLVGQLIEKNGQASGGDILTKNETKA